MIAALLTIALSVSAFCDDSSRIYLENRTSIDEVGVIAEIIANEILDFDTLNVIILPLPRGSRLDGAVEQDQTRPHTYTLLINRNLSRKELTLTMSHEFIHIYQYEKEGLEIFGDIWVWNPDNLPLQQDVTWGSMTFTEYETRKFEVDAYERQWDVNKKLHKILKNR